MAFARGVAWSRRDSVVLATHEIGAIAATSAAKRGTRVARASHVQKFSGALVGVVVLSLLVGCRAASPPVYVSGDQTTWTIPLVDPESPALVVEATVHGKGPYRFLLDPDSVASVIDDGVARDLNLYSSQHYFRVVNQNDTSVPRKLYEVLSLEAGELHISNKPMVNAPAGSLRAGGKVLHGILGGDILTRTMVVHIDRDRGVVQLALTGKQQIPANALAIRATLHDGTLYVPVKIQGDGEVLMQVRLGSAVSALDAGVLANVRARRFDKVAIGVDETGAAAQLNGGVVTGLELDGFAIPDVQLYRQADRRLEYPYAGFIGADALKRYDVVVDRDEMVLWLAPRA